jgi:hypothetical protein
MPAAPSPAMRERVGTRRVSDGEGEGILLPP